jgi:hypothetical protein
MKEKGAKTNILSHTKLGFNYTEFATIKNKSGLNNFKISVNEFTKVMNYTRIQLLEKFE